MSECALKRKANPLNLVMNRGQRDKMNRGKNETYSDPSTSSTGATPPLRDHPEYSSVRTGEAWKNVPTPPPPVKGKGSGKGKWKGWY